MLVPSPLLQGVLPSHLFSVACRLILFLTQAPSLGLALPEPSPSQLSSSLSMPKLQDWPLARWFYGGFLCFLTPPQGQLEDWVSLYPVKVPTSGQGLAHMRTLGSCGVWQGAFYGRWTILPLPAQLARLT